MIEKAQRQEHGRKHKIGYSKWRKRLSWVAVILGLIGAVCTLLTIWFVYPLLNIGIACVGLAVAILAIINLSGPKEPTEVDRTFQRLRDNTKPGKLP